MQGFRGEQKAYQDQLDNLNTSDSIYLQDSIRKVQDSLRGNAEYAPYIDDVFKRTNSRGFYNTGTGLGVNSFIDSDEAANYNRIMNLLGRAGVTANQIGQPRVNETFDSEGYRKALEDAIAEKIANQPVAEKRYSQDDLLRDTGRGSGQEIQAPSDFGRGVQTELDSNEFNNPLQSDPLTVQELGGVQNPSYSIPSVIQDSLTDLAQSGFKGLSNLFKRR